jgi:hypothetical protein
VQKQIDEFQKKMWKNQDLRSNDETESIVVRPKGKGLQVTEMARDKQGFE